MSQTERACITGAVIGAAAGAAIGYLYGTDAGTRLRTDLARLLDRATADADEARRLWTRLTDVWTEYEHDRATAIARGSSPRAWPPGGAA